MNPKEIKNEAGGRDKKIENRVDKILGQMTLEEKITLIGGKPNMSIYPIERLGIPEIIMSDGPMGASCYGPAAAFPAGIGLAASWNVDLARDMGRAMARECRARGVHILLGPGVNIYRAPMCGRNFEYYGEDPFLASRTTVAFVKGLQEEGVVATAKHFAANNMEYDRHHTSSDVDERTLHEIYLAAFRAAVMEADIGAIMNSYNPLNGVHCSENRHLLTEILKEQWGFTGLVMSDWGSTYDGVAAANAGLDLEMPFASFMNKKTLLPAIRDGMVKVATIDDKVRRILRVIIRMGFLDRPQLVKSYPLYSAESSKVALEGAREGIVLLKNERNILPLDRKKIKSLAVIGPAAHPAVFGGGGSSLVTPFRATSILDGILDKAGKDMTVQYSPDIFTAYPEQPANIPHVFTQSLESPDKEVEGFRGEYFANKNLAGEPVKIRIDREVKFKWSGVPVEGLGQENFSIRWTGKIKSRNTCDYIFMVRGDDGYRLYVDGNLVIDAWMDQPPTTRLATVSLKAKKPVEIRLEYYQHLGDAEIQLFWYDLSLMDRIKDLAGRCDAAIVCVGHNPFTESEGFDRGFGLPVGQEQLIRAVAKANPKTIVIVTAGGNVDIGKWVKHVPGLVHAWYPGQEGGTAVAEILFGDVNPSGKLPATFEKRWEDSSSYRSYFDEDGDKRVAYREGIFIGYRHFDKYHKEPLFPFGFGLSFTKFKYSNLRLSGKILKPGQSLKISVDVTNTGRREGKEVVQLYVRDKEASVERPEKELKGFAKISLKPGQKKTVQFSLDESHLSFYDVGTRGFKAEPGEFEVLIGSSSRNILLKDSFRFEGR